MTFRPLLPAVLLAAAAMPAGATILVSEEAGLSDYVQGRHAAANGDLDRAANLFVSAVSHTENDAGVLRTLLETAVAAGDFELALGAAERLDAAGEYDSAIGTLQFVRHVRAKRWKEADAAAERLTEAGFGNFITPILKAYILQARRKRSQALDALDVQVQEGLPKSYFATTRAEIALMQGRENIAITALSDLVAGDGGRAWRSRLLLADAYQEAKQDEFAAEALKDTPPVPEVLRARAMLAADRDLKEAPSNVRTALSDMFLRLAADISRNRPVPMALIFARSASWLDEDNERAWLSVAQYLQQAEQYDAALAAAERVSDDGLYGGMAQAQIATILTDMERAPEALSRLEAAAKAEGADAQAWANLGQAYYDADRHDDAIESYRTAQGLPTESRAMRWQLHFMIGAAEEARGDWEAAEAAFRQALEIAPDESITLNYLGYTLLDRDQKVDEAIGLIERAHALSPDNGHITDSLGWAQYSQGDYQKAVETLEKAILSVPEDATINDHLGDAYWRVGRQIEARFRWQAALDGEPSEEQETAIRQKLAFGLDRALAMQGDAPARP